ncbi:hypothetical protein Vi05172_g10333 [Venturia inaequalis]|nr:hypothetical protein Vi05172_g10333 [Venturia inaequalis]
MRLERRKHHLFSPFHCYANSESSTAESSWIQLQAKNDDSSVLCRPYRANTPTPTLTLTLTPTTTTITLFHSSPQTPAVVCSPAHRRLTFSFDIL